jgi:FK506-binding protein 1
VIQGWDEGVITMSLGEKAQLDITSDYGYGREGAGNVIPANADLMFIVELLKIGENEAPPAADDASSCCVIL